METLILILQIIAVVFGSLAVLLSIPLFFSFRWPAAAMWGLKIFISALSLLLALLGLLTAILGIATGSEFISFIGICIVLVYTIHIILITRPPAFSGSFEKAFGPDWENNIPAQQKNLFLPARIALRLPPVSEPQLKQNVPFASIPGTSRQIFCDIWQPPQNTNPSGLAFIYMHGSAFYFLDKDFCTRPLFRHLAAQGHVIMDVAYRLATETDIMGMIHDVKRAISWMKEHAADYGVQNDRIIVGGGSAGASLALMSAYTSNDIRFTPPELQGYDLITCAVISLYGPTDLAALYYHTNQHLTTRPVPGKPKMHVPTRMPSWMVKLIGKDYHRLGLDKNMGNIGLMAPLMGCHPDQCPERYAFLSPVSHVHAGCPPTLLIHGQHDIMAPVATTCLLHSLLLNYHVPVVMNILPQTDHAFDLVLPNISPAAHNALYDMERFMALMAVRKERTGTKTIKSNQLI